MSKQAKDREQWVTEAGLSSLICSGTLSKQRTSILQACYSGQVRSVEQAILAAVPFPSALQSTVSLHDVLHLGYKVTFDTGSEVISTEGTNLAKLNEWLVSKACAFKKGELHRQQRNTDQVVKDTVRFESAIDELRSKHKDCNVVDTLKLTTQGDPSVDPKSGGAEDVTDTILSVPKVQSVDLPSAQICIHRGSLKTFLKQGSSHANLSGILAGRVGWNGKCHITNIIQTTKSPTEIVSDEKLMQTISTMNLTIYGFIVCGPEDELRTQASNMLSTCECDFALLIGVDYTNKHVGEYFLMERQSDGEFKSVATSWTSNPNDLEKRMTYNICWDCDLGVSIVAATKAKICEAVFAHAVSACEKTQQPDITPMTRFECMNVPPDGLCGWHALLAGENIATFRSIPRTTAGYAVNARIVKQEEAAAKSLCHGICDKALTQCNESLHANIIRIKEEGQFAPLDLEWIAQVMQLSIRCTCSKKDRVYLCFQHVLYICLKNFI